MFREDIKSIDLSIRKIAEKASEAEETVRLDIGQPSFDTPEHVKQKAREDLERDQGYSPMMGIDELREEIVKEESIKEAGDSRLELGEENVMVTAGGMGALYSIFNAMLGRNDKAVFNDPCWGPYKLISQSNGNNWGQVPYWDSQGNLRDEAVKKISEAELVVVNTPSNPTGKVLEREQAREIGRAAEENNTFLVSDEVYHRMVLDGEHYSPATFTDKSAVIGSMSKNHAMTGWRVGWITGKKDHLEQFAKVSRATVACPPRISQYAAVEALRNDSHVEKMRKEYRKRRDKIVERMEDMGWSFIRPEGGIYTFPDTGKDSWDLCMDMVEKGVAMVPGEPMGPDSDTNVRLCFGSVGSKGIDRAFDILEDEID